MPEQQNRFGGEGWCSLDLGSAKGCGERKQTGRQEVVARLYDGVDEGELGNGVDPVEVGRQGVELEQKLTHGGLWLSGLDRGLDPPGANLGCWFWLDRVGGGWDGLFGGRGCGLNLGGLAENKMPDQDWLGVGVLAATALGDLSRRWRLNVEPYNRGVVRGLRERRLCRLCGVGLMVG